MLVQWYELMQLIFKMVIMHANDYLYTNAKSWGNGNVRVK